MTNTEMQRRLTTMTPSEIDRIVRMIDMGYGESGIKNETTFTRKQINAVFQLKFGAK
jgi:hypothetical protein